VTTYIGVDPSTNDIACAALHGDRIVMRSYPLRGREITTRVALAYEVPGKFITYLNKVLGRDEVIVALEAPVAVKNRQSLIKLSQVSGALIAGFGALRVNPLIVPPSTWKKEVVGRGNVNKSQVAGWVADSWPELHRHAAGDQDSLDAGCLARYAQAVDRRAGHVRESGVEI